MNPDQSNIDETRLDQLLHSARWPDVDSSRLESLENHWRTVLNELPETTTALPDQTIQEEKTGSRWILAAALSIAVASAIWMFAGKTDNSPDIAKNVRIVEPNSTDNAPDHGGHDEIAPMKTEPASTPNTTPNLTRDDYLAVFANARARRQARKQQNRSPYRLLVETVSTQIGKSPLATAFAHLLIQQLDQTVGSLRATREISTRQWKDYVRCRRKWESWAWKFADSKTADHRVGSTRFAVVVSTDRSLRHLEELLEVEGLANDACVSIAWLGGPVEIDRAVIRRQLAGGGFRRSAGIFGGPGLGGFGFPDQEPVVNEDIFNTLFDLLESFDPEAWETGGIVSLGTTMIITNSATNHEILEAHLQVIRETVSSATRSVTILITWLKIEGDQYDLLGAKTEQGIILVDPDKLKALAREYGATGSITCFDGQTVHLVSGEMKNWIKSLSPVVGSIDSGSSQLQISRRQAGNNTTRLASGKTVVFQEPVPNATTNLSGNIGYKTISETINYGAMLQLTAVTVPGTQEAMLDIHSNIVLPMNQPKGTETIDFAGLVKLDRLHLRSHQFATSLKLPLGKPVVVGGSTVQVGKDSSFYVILEVHADDE